MNEANLQIFTLVCFMIFFFLFFLLNIFYAKVHAH
jgi:preprotein translocase subunit SecG